MPSRGNTLDEYRGDFTCTMRAIRRASATGASCFAASTVARTLGRVAEAGLRTSSRMLRVGQWCENAASTARQRPLTRALTASPATRSSAGTTSRPNCSSISGDSACNSAAMRIFASGASKADVSTSRDRRPDDDDRATRFGAVGLGAPQISHAGERAVFAYVHWGHAQCIDAASAAGVAAVATFGVGLAVPQISHTPEAGMLTYVHAGHDHGAGPSASAAIATAAAIAAALPLLPADP
mmetsp:Transcript_11520/g.40225  ORF Transcript_11520/g.40225 Transcript_11520/m.40225 type:complete len:239 (-) Transcript_11520:1864-2580(-)